MSDSELTYPRQYLYRRVVQARLFIDAHFAEDIDLGQIADEAAFSRYHFLRLFRQIFGATPVQYRTRIRIAEARRLLGQGLPVAQVCAACGYESLGTFSNLFRRITGQSPAAYQTTVQARRNRQASQPRLAIPSCFAAGLDSAISDKEALD